MTKPKPDSVCFIRKLFTRLKPGFVQCVHCLDVMAEDQAKEHKKRCKITKYKNRVK